MGAEKPPPAPLDRAVEEVRGHFKPNGLAYTPFGEDVLALLAALDADKRLEEAEAALEEIEKFCECGDDPACPSSIARRYFARREGAAVRGEEEKG